MSLATASLVVDDPTLFFTWLDMTRLLCVVLRDDASSRHGCISFPTNAIIPFA